MARLQMLARTSELQRGQVSDNNTRALLEEVYHQITAITAVDRLFILDKNNIVKMNIVPKGENTFVGSNVSSLSWIKEATADKKNGIPFFLMVMLD
jgi:hypothetical protein